MSDKDDFGLWATKSEGGQWHAIQQEWLESAAEKAGAIGVRIGGKDIVYDFVLNQWRTPEDPDEQILPDDWAGGSWLSLTHDK